MHYVPNVEWKDPIVSAIVFDSQGATGRDLELLLYLKLIHLLKGLEWDLKFFLLSHSVLEEVPPLSKVQFTYLTKLLLYADQLLDDVMRVIDLFLEYFYPIWDVVTAAAIRGGWAVAAAFRNAPLSSSTERSLHAEIVLIIIVVTIARLSLRLASKEGV